MVYPEKMQHREHHALNHDYSRTATFFVTFRIHKRAPALCDIHPVTAEVSLTAEGRFVDEAIQTIPQQYPFITVNCYVIMPTHVHVVFIFAGQESVLSGNKPVRLGTVVGKIKGLASYHIRRASCPDFTWQRDHHDSIIRSQHQLEQVRNYIRNNPLSWATKNKLDRHR